MNSSVTDEVLQQIESWPHDDLAGLMNFVSSHWWPHFLPQMNRIPGTGYRLATGGWSDNEVILQALQQNRMVWARYWRSSHRGGLCILDHDPTD
jgi:hypothetical protein